MTVWVNLHTLAASWVKCKCDAALSTKFEAQYQSRIRTGSYESACWGALDSCKLHKEAQHMKELVRMLGTRQVGDEIEVNLGSSGLRNVPLGADFGIEKPTITKAIKAPTNTRPRGQRTEVTAHEVVGSAIASGKFGALSALTALVDAEDRRVKPAPKPKLSLLEQMREQARRQRVKG